MNLSERVYFTICRMNPGRIGLTKYAIIKEFRERFGDRYDDKNIRKRIKQLAIDGKLENQGNVRFRVANKKDMVRYKEKMKEKEQMDEDEKAGGGGGVEKKKKAAIVTAKQRMKISAKKQKEK